MKKRILYVTILLCTSLISVACSKGDNKEELDKNIDREIREEDKEFTYDVENPDAFCLDNDGNLYALVDNIIKVFDDKGVYIKEYLIEEETIAPYLSIHEDTIYFISLDSLYEFDLETETIKSLYQFEGELFGFYGMVALEDSIFIIQRYRNDKEQEMVRYDENDWYSYEGELLFHYDIVKNEMKTVNIPNIKLITKKNDTELLIYAYDQEGGFYFTSYNSISGDLGDKIYTDMKIDYISCMAYDYILDKVICNNMEGLMVTDIRDTSNQTLYYPLTGMTGDGNSLQYLNGYTYYHMMQEDGNKIIRIYNKAYIKDNPALKSYVLSSVGRSYRPDSFGYQLDFEELDYGDLATVLLAGDADYDFLILSSEDQMGRIMRDLGAYEPLDSIEGVRNVLGRSYNYIEEAATTEEGDIWMLPLDIDCPILIYNPSLCEQYGIDIADIDTYEKLINAVVPLPEDDSVLYNIPYYMMTIDITNKYLMEYGVQGNKSYFDTSIFRKYAEIMSIYDENEIDGEGVFGKRIGIGTYFQDNLPEYLDEYYSNVLLVMKKSRDLIEEYYGFDFFKASATPGLEEGKEIKSKMSCYFIVLNPNSNKLEYVKEYLSLVCNSMLEENDSFMFKDFETPENQLEMEIREIYSNGQIFFEYPYEIFSDEMMAYRYDGKPLDEAIKEMERKMDMYLNE